MRKAKVSAYTGKKVLFVNPLTKNRKEGRVLSSYVGLAWNTATQKAEPQRYFMVKWGKKVGRVAQNCVKLV